MPRPKQPKKSKLPPDKGIKPISFSGPSDAGDGLTVHLGQADRSLVKRICADLEQCHNRSFNPDQVVRWALWHCRWEEP